MKPPRGNGSGTTRTRPGDRTIVVHDSIRDSILQGEYKEGTWLSQVQIAKQYGVSRGPVREAFRLLERESLIETRVNRRARVARFSIEDLEQLYATRIVTEALGLSVSVPRFTDDDLVYLEATFEEMEQATGDLGRWEVIHRGFHLSLTRYAGERMVQGIGQRIDHSERYRRVYITRGPRAWSVGAEEHREIVDACVARDAPLAADLLAHHLCRTALTVFMLAAPEHEPALIRAALQQASHKLSPPSRSHASNSDVPGGIPAMNDVPRRCGPTDSICFEPRG